MNFTIDQIEQMLQEDDIVIYEDMPIHLTELNEDNCIVYDESPINIKKLSENNCIIFDDSPIHVESIEEFENFILYDEYPKKMSEEEIEKRKNEKPTINTKPSIEDAVADFRAGCSEAFDYVYRYYKPKINYMAKTKGGIAHYEDLLSEINIQLIKCMQSYKFGAVKFTTFFWRCAQNTVGMFFTHLTAKKRTNEFGEVSLSAKTDSEQKIEVIDTITDESATCEFNNVLFKETLEKAILPFLNDKDSAIIKMCALGHEISEISRSLKMTKAGVYLRLKKIRNNVKLKDALMQLKYSLA